ncbi:carboxyl transferase domain-containing protein [Austwickia chelonae]|uniref:carboxyl transferase domain-containing protein n=1 Tax=Austwickia chelonae TaxID=100225 RepID=UPI000E22B330|nr:carboxyl transferase domain-containing protein [Austwickia chelonae]
MASTTQQHTYRIAILDGGDTAQRIIAAVDTLHRDHGTPSKSLAAHPEHEQSPWYTRDADATIPLPTRHSPQALAELLADHGTTHAWCPDPEDHYLAEALTTHGITPLSPPRTHLDALADPAWINTQLTGLDLAHHLPDQPQPGRVLETVLLRDHTGHVCILGPAEHLHHDGEHPTLSELPAMGLTDDTARLTHTAALRLAEALDLRGTLTLRFTLDPDQRLTCHGIDATGRPEHSLWNSATGTDLTALHLHTTLGGELPAHLSTHPHTVQLRLLTTPDSPPATVLAHTPATGLGIHHEPGPRPTDRIDPATDRTLSTITAWGHHRDHALHRAQNALDRTHISLTRGDTNRHDLRTALHTLHTPARHPETDSNSDLAALLIAATEFHTADLRRTCQEFRTGADRGRPTQPAPLPPITLTHHGHQYRLHVRHIAPRTFHIHDLTTHDGGRTTVVVDTIDEHHRRITHHGHTHRATTTVHDDHIRLDLDGHAHTLTRQDGILIRATAPALVTAILVDPGTQIHPGQPLAIVESMKMSTTIHSEFAGEVTTIDAHPHQQITTGSALMRIRPHGPIPPTPDTDPTHPRLHLTDTPTTHPLDRAHTYLLGYDLDTTPAQLLTEYQNNTTEPTTHTLTAEDTFLDLFADIASLHRPRTDHEPTDTTPLTQTDTQEYFTSYLTWLDTHQAGLPPRYRERLDRALTRYGTHTHDNRTTLENATLWLFRSFTRIPSTADLTRAILRRRLNHTRTQPHLADHHLKKRLEKLTHATDTRQPDIADLARDLLFHLYDEPLLHHAEQQATTHAHTHLAALADHHETDQHIDALVAHPYPLTQLLVDSWRQAAEQVVLGQPAPHIPATDPRPGILLTHLRRTHRTHTNATTSTTEGVLFARATHHHSDTTSHVLTAFTPHHHIHPTLTALNHHLDHHATPGEKTTIELVTWEDHPTPTALDLTRHHPHPTLHRLNITHLTDHTTHHHSYTVTDTHLTEDPAHHDLHPCLAAHLHLWRLQNFTLRRLPAPPDVHLFDATAKDNPQDHRLIALADVRDLTPTHDAHGNTTYPHLGRLGAQALAAIRAELATYPARHRPHGNLLMMMVRPRWDIPTDQWTTLANTYATLARGAELEKVTLHVDLPHQPDTTITVEGLAPDSSPRIRLTHHNPDPIPTRSTYAQKVHTAARFGSPYPYEIIRMLTPDPQDSSAFPTGTFTEMDLGPHDELTPTPRDPGHNQAHLVVGTLTNITDTHPEGMTRVAILSDPTNGLGNLAEPECRRINAALAYATQHHLPVEWYAVSSGALIAMDSGTENMDWISLTLRRIIEFTQSGGEINIIVTGINVGGQPYWNAEATMLMHTRGILIMTPASQMVLTGKQALEYSGAMSAEDNHGIGGYHRIMGPNGQAQYWAPTFADACHILLRHYDHTYLTPGEHFPRRRPTQDPTTRDIRTSPHHLHNSTLNTIGDIFDPTHNADRKTPFDMRSVMKALSDTDHQPLERWRDWHGADTVITWDTTIGGIPVCLLGLESHPITRTGYIPADGPPSWTAGTLFPQASRKCARTINATSGNRPLVVLANLSGFDGSPESMRNWQLEYGAEIGRAITNFRGPIIFVVVSRYHGGAFVVFSKQLNPFMEIAAITGSYASVIGGAPAAATVFVRDVKKRTEQDPRVLNARHTADQATGPHAHQARLNAQHITDTVRSQRLREVADEFDAVHTVERALRVGSVDRIIAPQELRPYVIDALERGMAAYTVHHENLS